MIKILLTILISFACLTFASVPVYTFETGADAKLAIGGSNELKRTLEAHQPIQVYRICVGKKKTNCGYWENTETKKKVANAPVTVNKGDGNLILKNVTEADSGSYYNGEVYLSVQVFPPITD
ncbi:unnamed protein product [Caenorhabditis angaria]|uniref:Uncharacterized protein n=1 Tax=Caenorhabditis angaria TaxID=860376 RepID=A0A9P1IXK0_9PELO|nr:unnamed protein product [Caenorhabditis angaria]